MPHRPLPARSRCLAKDGRREPTRAEEMLWQALRDRRFSGLKFRRQCPIGRYVADFICFEARLVVELDGAPHDEPEQRVHDEARDRWFRAQGFRVLRFSNDLVLGGGSDLVLQAVQSALASDPSSDLR